jgi:hypothetical protein
MTEETTMRLTDLNPLWVDAGGPGISDRNGNPVPARHGIGIIFDCPCGCRMRSYVDFSNPLDGGPPFRDDGHSWQRTGETFETLTLYPSIKRDRAWCGCAWHGWIKGGEVTGQVEA